MNEHDKALEWANANPGDPRSQHIQAKAWAIKNPDDPRSTDILKKLSSQTYEKPENKWQTANVIEAKEKSFSDNINEAVKSKIDQLYAKPEMKDFKDKIDNADFGKAAANVLLPQAGMASKLAGSALGRIGLGSLTGATLNRESPENAVSGALIGGALGIGGEAASALGSGLGRAADTAKKALQFKSGSPSLQQEAQSKIDSTIQELSKDVNQSDLVKFLGSASNRPLTRLSSSNPDARASLNSAGEKSGTDIADYASQLRSAKQISDHPLTGTPTALALEGLKGATSSLGKEAGISNSPATLSALLELISNKQEKK